MPAWIFASKTVENIRRGYERLLWGFWDRDAGQKQRQNWRRFITAYNRVKSFDLVALQLTTTFDIYAVGVVREKFYDDQNPVWEQEFERKKILFPWWVSFSTMLFREQPLMHYGARQEDFIDGYGLGELSGTEAISLLEQIGGIFGVFLKWASQ